MNENRMEIPVTESAVRPRTHFLLWLLLLTIIGVSFASVFIPAWLIMPFKGQTASGVTLSYALKSWSPWITPAALIATIALCFRLWPSARWYGRLALIISLILAGINNQNFIMRDEETGSWWQQVTGEAIQGPLKGTKLKPVFHDELSFGVWKREQPAGRVLKPDLKVASKYEAENWGDEYARLPVVVPHKLGDKLKPRDLVLGIRINDASKAYPFADLQ